MIAITLGTYVGYVLGPIFIPKPPSSAWACYCLKLQLRWHAGASEPPDELDQSAEPPGLIEKRFVDFPPP